jgi:hypothetical protein
MDMKTRILCFDTPRKCKDFQGFLGKSKLIDLTSTYSPDEALQKMLQKPYDVILLGGDADKNELKSAALYHMMEEWECHKRPHIYITTWDTEEAKILRTMSKKSLYVPFSEVLGKIVKTLSAKIRVDKRKKIRQNKAN